MMTHMAAILVAELRTRWRTARNDDGGATSIEWAMFALLALVIGGLVAGAITLAINNRIPFIK